MTLIILANFATFDVIEQWLRAAQIVGLLSTSMAYRIILIYLYRMLMYFFF